MLKYALTLNKQYLKQTLPLILESWGDRGMEIKEILH